MYMLLEKNNLCDNKYTAQNKTKNRICMHEFYKMSKI